MTRRLLALTLLVICAALVVASTASHAAYVLRTTINTDRSVTIEWGLGATDVSNLAVVVDCCVVRSWVGVDRSTKFTTAPLAAGRHTIAIQVSERYWTSTYYDPASCEDSERESFRWVCKRRTWTTPVVVLIPIARGASCVVPMVMGLRLRDARTRIAKAHCAVGVVTRKSSARPLGVVLGQRPKEKVRLARNATVALVVSNGLAPV